MSASRAQGSTGVAVRRLDTTTADFETAFARVLHWSAETDRAIETSVEQIMNISSRLVVNQASLKLKREPIRALIQAFESAIPK